MTKFAHAALALMLWACGPQAQACMAPGDADALATGLAQGVNLARAQHGLPVLGTDALLMAAAQRQACDVARTGRMEHRGSDGSNSNDRVLQAGYPTCLTAENLAWGFTRPDRIVGGWLGSPGHRSNMLHARMSRFGIGVAQGAQGPVWVLVLARPC